MRIWSRTVACERAQTGVTLAAAPSCITHDSELPPVRIDRRLKEWSHPAVRLHAVQEDCGFLQHQTFFGRSRRHSRTIAPSPKRRWDKPSGQNFASYDELSQSVRSMTSPALFTTLENFTVKNVWKLRGLPASRDRYSSCYFLLTTCRINDEQLCVPLDSTCTQLQLCVVHLIPHAHNCSYLYHLIPHAHKCSYVYHLIPHAHNFSYVYHLISHAHNCSYVTT